MRVDGWQRRPLRAIQFGVNGALRTLIETYDGVLSRGDALATVPPHVLEYAARAGKLTRLYPGTYVDPARAVEPWTRVRAALRFAGPDAVLSHLTALGVWRLPGGTLDAPVHVLVPAGRRWRGAPGLVVHRRRDFDPAGPGVMIRSGLPTSRVEQSVVDSWALLAGDTRRAAVISAVGDRLTTPDRLLRLVDANRSLPDRQELLRMVNLLARGCRSELELWGYESVFTGPDMPKLEWNVPVQMAHRTIYLDAYCPEARVDFELDGAKHHTSLRDRERDARRDAALAAMGIMVVRFTHDQLVHTPELVREQIKAIVAARRSGPVHR